MSKALRRFRVELVGDETHEIQTRYSDLLLVERTLISAGLKADGRENPVHYATALIWAALVRLQLTAVKFREFPDLLVDFDEIDTDQDEGDGLGLDPTRPAAPTGPPST